MTRRSLSKLDGFAIALAIPAHRPLSVAVYLQALRRGRLQEFARPEHTCRHCARPATFQVRFRDRVTRRLVTGCPACMPWTRLCRSCRTERVVSMFEINPDRRCGFKLEPYCDACRRTLGAARYADHQDVAREVPERQRCRRCEQVKPADAFTHDGRYASGLYNICKTCRNQETVARRHARMSAETPRASRPAAATGVAPASGVVANPVSYYIESDAHVVHVNLRGDVSFAALCALQDDYLSDPAYEPGMSALVSCAVLTSIPEPSQIRKLALDRLLRSASVPTGRAAIVAKAPIAQKFAGLMELFSDAPAQTVRAFRTEREAREWLGVRRSRVPDVG